MLSALEAHVVQSSIHILGSKHDLGTCTRCFLARASVDIWLRVTRGPFQGVM